MTSIKIARAGPILDGEIELSQLTILAGPNGSGKSYAAMLLHGLNRDEDWRHRLPYRLASAVYNELDNDISTIYERSFQELQENDRSTIPTEAFNTLVNYYFSYRFENQYNKNIESVFSTTVTNLIKSPGHRNIRIDIKSDLGYSELVCWKKDDGLSLRNHPTVDQDPLLVLDMPKQKLAEIDRNYHGEVIPIDSDLDIGFGPEHVSVLAGVFSYLQSQLDLRYPSSSHFLPAARSGVLQSHEVLTKGAFDSLSQVGVEPIEVPAFSGVVSSYLKQLVELSNAEEGELATLADEIERKVLSGKINVEQQSDKPHPKITFKEEGQEYQLHLASTSVSELAPLILYTRYVLTKDSTVVIEEPESHLHPENQRLVAYFIAKLVNEGVRVIVTTHSDFFIAQLNNCIRVSQVDSNLRQESELSDLPPVPPENVSVHLFSETDRSSGGYEINQISVDGLEGIPTDEFDEVSENLYGESFKIDRLLEESINNVN